MNNAQASAFPSVVADPGLTKRELFAAMAMQGWLANKDRPTHFDPKDDMAYCVKIADSLLKALQPPSGGGC